ncbi:hypothetical protein P7K49_005435 [Saguinus oedipus]|uniref:Guided entry of tail-anchored proteins factor n=1 Tax=Saguinus oedipus TaxID=9490 RepID=A0ABQ9WA94_SAGOE|nr:hypothetical protein P7K49_005435 [Saguinus oedipus]
MESIAIATDDGDRPGVPAGSGLSASQRRAELHQRKLLMNSEQGINWIMGFHRPGSSTKEEMSKRVVLGDSVSTGTTDQQGGMAEVKGTQLGDKLDSFIKPPECSNDVNLELRQQNRGDLTVDMVQTGSHHGLEQYLSRFKEAMKLRKQLISEKPNQEDGSTTEEFDSFRIFRLVGCALLALGVRAFVCKYLSIFAPFLTLQLAYMGFPKSEKKIKTTVLTAALLLWGIPAEVINRSLDTYSKMGEVFTDLCVYFFTFIFCHELLDYWGSEVP